MQSTSIPRLRIAAALALSLLAALLFFSARAGAIASAAAKPSGYWKLFMTVDYSTESTATDSRCYANGADTPSTVSANATETFSIRTVRPGVLVMHEHASGVGIAEEDYLSPPTRLKMTATRTSGLQGDVPRPCFDESRYNYKLRDDCGTNSGRDGISISPLGGRSSWQGFTLWPRTESFDEFEFCSLTEAQENLPLGLESLKFDLRASPRKLTSHSIPKLVFSGSKRYQADGRVFSVASTATGTLRYRIKLVRTKMSGS